jgi:hypothetical protein
MELHLTTCESCAEQPAEWEISPIEGSRPEVLCSWCATKRLGAAEWPADPLGALRRRLGAMDAATRARVAGVLAAQLAAELHDIRVVAVQELHTRTGSWAKVADAVGLTRTRAAALGSGREQRGRRRQRRDERLEQLGVRPGTVDY